MVTFKVFQTKQGPVKFKVKRKRKTPLHKLIKRDGNPIFVWALATKQIADDATSRNKTFKMKTYKPQVRTRYNQLRRQLKTR
jgi:hypothetical protein